MGVNSFISAVVHSGPGTLHLPNSHTQQQLASSSLMNLITRNVNGEGEKKKKGIPYVSLREASWTVCHFPSPLYDLQIRPPYYHLPSQSQRQNSGGEDEGDTFRGVRLLFMASFESWIASSSLILPTHPPHLKGTGKCDDARVSTPLLD